MQSNNMTEDTQEFKRPPGRPPKIPIDNPYTYAPYGLPPADPAEQRRNVEKFGFPCPRDHFIYSTEDLEPVDVANMWGIGVRELRRWWENGNWQNARSLHRSTQPLVETEVSLSQLQHEQQLYMETRKRVLNTMLRDCEADLKKKTEKKLNAQGREMNVDVSQQSKKLLADRTLQVLDAMAIGLAIPVKGAARNQPAEEEDDGRPKPVTQIEVVRPEKKALSQPHDSVEGEVYERDIVGGADTSD